MPDNPVPDGRPGSPEEELRARIEHIESDEAERRRASQPQIDPASSMPEPPSNDEIRARLFASPIEAQLGENAGQPDDERRLSQLTGGMGPGVPEDPVDRDSGFDERLAKFEKRAKALKSVNDAAKEERLRNERADRESSRGLGVGLAVAYTIIGVPLGGVLVGWLIDRRSGTTGATAIGMLVGCGLAIVAAALMLKRANQRL